MNSTSHSPTVRTPRAIYTNSKWKKTGFTQCWLSSVSLSHYSPISTPELDALTQCPYSPRFVLSLSHYTHQILILYGSLLNYRIQQLYPSTRCPKHSYQKHYENSIDHAHIASDTSFRLTHFPILPTAPLVRYGIPNTSTDRGTASTPSPAKASVYTSCSDISV